MDEQLGPSKEEAPESQSLVLQGDVLPAERSATTHADTPGELARMLRQEEVFRRRIIQKQTVRQVAEEMGLSLGTVVEDCKIELQRRADELSERRELEKAAQLAMVDDLYTESMAAKHTPGSGALGAAGKALEMRSKLLGLDAPTKIDVGLRTLLQAFDESSRDSGSHPRLPS